MAWVRQAEKEKERGCEAVCKRMHKKGGEKGME
jgi:hypothetical protein